MWNQEKLKRFQWLRQRELDDALTEAEHAELLQMIGEIEAREAAYLRPATERLRDERESIEAQNRALQSLVQRKSNLVARLQTLVGELEAEDRAINEEFARIIGGSSTIDTGADR